MVNLYWHLSIFPFFFSSFLATNEKKTLILACAMSSVCVPVSSVILMMIIIIFFFFFFLLLMHWMQSGQIYLCIVYACCNVCIATVTDVQCAMETLAIYTSCCCCCTMRFWCFVSLLPINKKIKFDAIGCAF